LNFFADVFLATGFLTAMNFPDDALRLVQALALPSFVFTWLRFFTAPLRALSPAGLFTAMSVSCVGRPTEGSRDIAKCSCAGTEPIARGVVTATDGRAEVPLLEVSGSGAIQSLFHARNESKFAHLNPCSVA
jgi:hypothetical protein